MSTKDDRRGTTEAKGGGMFNRLFRRGTKDPPPLSTKDLTIVAGLPVPAPNPDPAKTRDSSGGVEKQSKSGKKASSSVHSMSSSSSKGSKGKKKKKHRDSSVSSRGSRSSKSSKGSRGKKRKTSDRIKRPPRESLASNKSKSSSKKSDKSDKTPSSTVVPSTSKSPTAVPTPPVPSSSSSSKKTTSTTKVLKVKPDGKPEAPAPASSKKAPADASGSPAAYTSDKGRLRVSSSENPPAPPTNPGRAGDYGGSADDETDNARGLMTPAPPKISGKPAPTPAPAPPTNGGGGGGGGGGNSSDESDNEPASDEDIEYGFVPFRDGPGVSLPMYDSGYHRPAGLPAPAVHPRDRALERQSSKTKLAGELEAAPAVQMNSLSATPKVKKSLFDDDDVFDESELAGILGDISRNERGGTASILAEDNDISEDFLERGRRTSVESVESIEDEPPSVHATRGMAFVDESFHVRRGSTSAGSDGATGALGEYEFADDGPPQIPAHLRR